MTAIMTKEEIAARLDGFGYPFTPPKDVQIDARAVGLVIVYGASDDLMELCGAIDDEISACDGVTIWLNEDGVFDETECADRCNHFESAFQHVREYGQKIVALWDPGDWYSWRYETAIPHVTFEIVEDGQKYCRGIIFAVADVERKETTP